MACKMVTVKYTVKTRKLKIRETTWKQYWSQFDVDKKTIV